METAVDADQAVIQQVIHLPTHYVVRFILFGYILNRFY